MIFCNLKQAVVKRAVPLAPAIALLPLCAGALEINDIVADSIQAHPEILERVHVFRQADRDRDIAGSG